jgi:hypothetical protein
MKKSIRSACCDFLHESVRETKASRRDRGPVDGQTTLDQALKELIVLLCRASPEQVTTRSTHSTPSPERVGKTVNGSVVRGADENDAANERLIAVSAWR